MWRPKRRKRTVQRKLESLVDDAKYAAERSGKPIIKSASTVAKKGNAERS